MSNWENLDLCEQAVLSCGISNFSIPMKKKEEMSFGRATTNDAAFSIVSHALSPMNADEKDILSGADISFDINFNDDVDLEGYYFDHNPNHKGAIRKIVRDKGGSNYIIWGWDTDAPELGIWSASMSRTNDGTYTVIFYKSEDHPKYTCEVHFEQNGMICFNWSKLGTSPNDVENKWTKIQIPETILERLVRQQSNTSNMSSLGIISGTPKPAPPMAAPMAHPPGPPGPPGPSGPPGQ